MVGLVSVGDGTFGILFVMLLFALPVVAIIVAIKNLRGALRIFWVAAIAVAFFFIPLIGLILSVCFLVFKNRFADWQRVSYRNERLSTRATRRRQP